MDMLPSWAAVAFGGGVYYGTPSDARHTKGDIYISGASLYDAQWSNVDSARAWILKNLKQQGVVLREEL